MINKTFLGGAEEMKKLKQHGKKRGEGDWSLHGTQTSSTEGTTAMEGHGKLAAKKTKKHVYYVF